MNREDLLGAKINQFRNLLAEKQIYLKNVTQCADKTTLPIIIAPIRIVEEEKNMYYTYGEASIKEDFPRGFRGNVHVKQCPPDYNSNIIKCKTFINNFVINQICDILKSYSEAYSPFLDKIVPRPKCPIRKGVLRLIRIPVHQDMIKYLPLTVSDWHMNVTAYVQQRLVACFTVELSIKLLLEKNVHLFVLSSIFSSAFIEHLIIHQH